MSATNLKGACSGFGISAGQEGEEAHHSEMMDELQNKLIECSTPNFVQLKQATDGDPCSPTGGAAAACAIYRVKGKAPAASRDLPGRAGGGAPPAR